MQPFIQHIKERLTPIYPAEEIKAITRLVLEKRFGISMLDIYVGKDIQFSVDEAKEWEDILRRLTHHEPIQYILGEADFYGLTFKVNKNVLIPRQETTELIEWMMKGKSLSGSKILDIGTGSGCIPIVLSKHYPTAQLYGWDISAEVLETARENNRLNGTMVEFEQVDVLSATPNAARQFDVIVSNPPYVTQRERQTMESHVLEWEPALALFVPDNDPLLFYREIAQLGQRLLRPNGQLYFEINRAFGKEMKQLLADSGYAEIELKKDISGNDRMIKATR